MNSIKAKLNMLLAERTEIAAQSPLQAARAIARQVELAERRLADMRTTLTAAIDRISGDLAMLVRRLKPGLNISLDKTGCRVGYKVKTLLFTPDLQTGVWRVDSPDSRFLSKFRKFGGHALELAADAQPLAQTVADFFTSYYRTLDEEVCGDGMLYIAGRPATGFQLMEWRLNSRYPGLPSRLPHRHA